MAQVSTVDLVKEDQEHLFHLASPADHQSPRVWVKGEGIPVGCRGAAIYRRPGLLVERQCRSRPSRVGQVAATQMAELAYCSSYAGATNIPATKLAAKLASLAYPSLNTVYFTSGGAESTRVPSRPPAFIGKLWANRTRSRSLRASMATMG